MPAYGGYVPNTDGFDLDVFERCRVELEVLDNFQYVVVDVDRLGAVVKVSAIAAGGLERLLAVTRSAAQT